MNAQDFLNKWQDKIGASSGGAYIRRLFCRHKDYRYCVRHYRTREVVIRKCESCGRELPL